MRRFFVRGLAALLPTVLTLWVLIALVGFITDYIAAPVTRAIHWSLVTNRLGKQILETTTEVRIFDPKYINPKVVRPGVDPQLALRKAESQSTFLLDLTWIDRDRLYADLSEHIPPAVGLALGFALIFVLGVMLRLYFGALLFRRGEKLLSRFPFVRAIYPYAKKIVDFLFSEESRRRDFKSVVAVQYPSPGRYTLGFVTSEGLESLNEKAGDDYVAVYLPSSPTPMTGFLVFVKRTEVIPLDLTLDQTMGMIISGGVIVPDAKQLAGKKKKRRPAAGVGEAPSLLVDGSAATESETTRTMKPGEDA